MRNKTKQILYDVSHCLVRTKTRILTKSRSMCLTCVCVFQQIFNVCVCQSTLLHEFVLSSRLIVSLLLSPFIRLCIKRGGLAVCAVGGSRVSVLFCSFIGWGCKWKALCTRSPLFLSSCVLTFSLYLSPLPLSPSRTTH